MDDDSPLSTIEAPDTNVFEVDIDSNVATSDSGNDTNTLCSVCGFQSSSVYGLQTHMTNYHGKRTHECDICFRLFCTDSTRTRHRHSHFESEGILTQAGIVLHRLALERLKKEENLTGDLLQQIKNFTEEMLKKKIVSSACNGSVTETHAEKSGLFVNVYYRYVYIAIHSHRVFAWSFRQSIILAMYIFHFNVHGNRSYIR